MLITRKRADARVFLVVSALLVVAAVAGCSDSKASEGSADPSSSSSAGSGYQAALDYAKCMRENGVPDYPDPEQGNDGRVLINPGGSSDDPNTQAAQEACRDKMPQGVARDRNGSADSAKVAAWAKCIRENGVPKFADPEVEGGMIKVNITTMGMDPSDARWQKASAACQSKSPGGSIIFEDGQ